MGYFIKLTEYGSQKEKEQNFLNRDEKIAYSFNQDEVEIIPGAPIVYWLSKNILGLYDKGKLIGEIANPKQGSTLGDNATFLRLWFEIDKSNTVKWYKCMKGGEYRKWYGNMMHVLDWENEGARVKATGRATIRSENMLFHKGITWSNISSSKPSFRFMDEGYFFESTGSVCFCEEKLLLPLMGYLNSKIVQIISAAVNPTLHLQSGDVAKIPILVNELVFEKVSDLVKRNIEICKNEWDSYEISWDFRNHSLCGVDGIMGRLIKDKYVEWERHCNEKFNILKSNEEEINRLFIELYGLSDEIDYHIPEEEIAYRKANLQREIKSLISYAVGCMFGRYSLDEEGVICTNQRIESSRYKTFEPVSDNIILISDEQYIENDILEMFCKWLKVVYGEDTLEENLDFIATALEGKGNTSREVIRNYLIKDFYIEHSRTYQKRPIYWLFDSGKQNGFKALVYMHRYDVDTVGKLRVDYLHRMERIYENEINRMQDTIDNSSNAREVTAASKRKEKLQKQLKECQEYDEKIGHLALSRIDIDLDDGVKVNYEKVQTANDGKMYQVLAKI